jgi:hypothetical protein
LSKLLTYFKLADLPPLLLLPPTPADLLPLALRSLSALSLAAVACLLLLGDNKLFTLFLNFPRKFTRRLPLPLPLLDDSAAAPAALPPLLLLPGVLPLLPESSQSRVPCKLPALLLLLSSASSPSVLMSATSASPAAAAA